MKALIYHGPRDVRCDDVSDATPRGTDGAVVEVTCCGICGSDLHIYAGHGFSPVDGYCVGHEAVGRVVEVGSDVRSFAVGDRVLIPASTGCGACGPCHAGRVIACENGSAACYGIGPDLPGCQAQAVAVPHADGNLTRIPDGISDEAAVVLTDNAATAWYGARRANIRPGETVAVVGLGPVGLMCVQAALLMGAARVLGIDLVPARRAAAAALGAEPVEGDDAHAAVLELTGGRGADVALEAVGPDAAVKLALQVTRRGGRVSIVGVNQSMDFKFPMALAQWNELELHIGLCSVQYELPTLLALTEAGRLDPAAVVSHTFALSEGAEAYRLYDAREDGVSKVVLDPRT